MNKEILENLIVVLWRAGAFQVIKDVNYIGHTNNACKGLLEVLDASYETTLRTIKKLRNYTETLASFLREAVSVEIAETNIGLQRSVGRLTILAIVLGILSRNSCGHYAGNDKRKNL